jgi:hypothetical protein
MSTRSPAHRRTIARRRLTALSVVLTAAALVHSLPADGDTRPPRKAAAAAAAPKAPPSPDAVLARIARCESAGDPAAISPDWRYRGKYQFDLATWRTVGGSGDPAAAPEREQDARARTLLERRGVAPWPVCGPRALAAAAA